MKLTENRHDRYIKKTAKHFLLSYSDDTLVASFSADEHFQIKLACCIKFSQHLFNCLLTWIILCPLKSLDKNLYGFLDLAGLYCLDKSTHLLRKCYCYTDMSYLWHSKAQRDASFFMQSLVHLTVHKQYTFTIYTTDSQPVESKSVS